MHPVLVRNNIKILGEGSQIIVFAHGFGCTQSTWKYITHSFLKDYKVILFDYIGSGNTDISQYDYHKYATLEGYACDVLDIIAALQLQEIIFVGHSVSAMIGMIAAIQKPDVFKKLIFIGPSPKYLNDQHYIGGFKTEDIAALFNHIVDDYSGWAKAISPAVLDCPHKPELTEFLIECFEETNPSIALAFAMATFKTDCREKLKELSVPSLTLAMANDPLVPLHIGEYIREYTPNNFLVVMKATGHFPQICEPEETVKEIKKFIMDEHMC
ncbi:alpha/beta fold hydrolase [Pedobacter psychrotolerans]|uniref:alpha/beta fold hydrolase n=1 Tax=Pedobacter psychrotolerans TaxID=1843235 RepID=UPI003F9D6FF2